MDDTPSNLAHKASWTKTKAARVALFISLPLPALVSVGAALFPSPSNYGPSDGWFVAMLVTIGCASVYGGIFTSAIFRLSDGLRTVLAIFAMIPAFTAVHLALSFGGCALGASAGG